MPKFPVFEGNCPGNVSKDAKYSVKLSGGNPRIGLLFETDDGETWHASTEVHPKLATMVNEVKSIEGAGVGGAFYINEYKQVIVPAVGSMARFYAGDYSKPLRFEFEGKTLSGEPVNLKGNPLSPGDTWEGPHPGIPYVLAAGGADIYYQATPRPNVTKKVQLSKIVGSETAVEVAAPVNTIKGHSGGVFYVNEFLAMFAPVEEHNGWRYVYIGQLDLSKWFPRPHSSAS